MASGVKCDSAASSLLGVGVEGPSRSQESPVLARFAPPSVEPSASERDLRSRSREVGDSSEGRFALAIPGPVCLVRTVLRKGNVVPARGLVGCVAGLASRVLAPQPVCSRVDEDALAGACHAPPLPACGLGGPGRSLWAASGAVRFTHALGVAIRC